MFIIGSKLFEYRLKLFEKENYEQLKERFNNWKEELRKGTTLGELCFYSSRVAGLLDLQVSEKNIQNFLEWTK